MDLILVHGWAFELRDPAQSRRAAAEAWEALDRLVALGLPFASGADGVRRFDPSEVLNFVVWTGLQGLEPLWRSRFTPTGRRLAWEARESGWRLDRPPPNEGDDIAFHVELSRTFRGKGPGRGRFRLPLPIEDATLDDLEVAFRGPEGNCQLVQSPARLDVLTAPSPGQPVTAGVALDFTARPWAPRPAPLSADERELYTRPREGLVKVTAPVVELASRLASGRPEPMALLAAFWDYALDELCCGVIRYDALDPARPLDWVLENGWFDCQLGAALIVAVCRARRIPARIAGGYLLRPTSPCAHYWAEVWLEETGWTPFDLISWDLSAGGADGAWRHAGFARLDACMTTQRLPRLFNGVGSVRLPPAWRLLSRAVGRGVETELYQAAAGALVYSERIEVEVRR